MFQKSISNLEKNLHKIYKASKRDSVSIGLANKHGLQQALARFERDLHREVSKEGTSLKKTLIDSYITGYRDETGVLRRPLKKANQTINYPWSGMNYQQRLGKNYMEMVMQMRNVITKELKGSGNLSNILLAIRDIEDKYRQRHELLVRTEIRHMHYQGELEGYKKNKVSHIQYVTIGDHRVCPECQALEEYNDGIYPIEEAPMLPRHPHCRCKEIPYEK